MATPPSLLQDPSGFLVVFFFFFFVVKGSGLVARFFAAHPTPLFFLVSLSFFQEISLCSSIFFLKSRPTLMLPTLY